MTTKKKDSPSASDSKTESSSEGQRQEQRTEDAFPPFDEMANAVERFRNSFSDALHAVDRVVSESRRLACQLREEHSEAEADTFDEMADLWEAVASQEFRDAATGVVDLVDRALVAGHPDNVLKMGRRLRLYDRAEWARICESLHVSLAGRPKNRSDNAPWPVNDLMNELKEIDSRAGNLGFQQLVEARRSAPTPARLAAKLACQCGAFDYEDEETAKRAFAIALKARGTEEFQ